MCGGRGLDLGFPRLAGAGSATERRRSSHLVDEMLEGHAGLDDTYRSPQMTDGLQRRGHCVNHMRVERLMLTPGMWVKDGRRRRGKWSA